MRFGTALAALIVCTHAGSAAASDNVIHLLSNGELVSEYTDGSAAGDYGFLKVSQLHTAPGEASNRIVLDLSGGLFTGQDTSSIDGGPLSSAKLFQRGYGNTMDIKVAGLRNELSVYQDGSQNMAEIRISGISNGTFVHQTGISNQASVSQNGRGNHISISQRSW